jgi:anhydro-N-acetylmuramic acid kinase
MSKESVIGGLRSGSGFGFGNEFGARKHCGDAIEAELFAFLAVRTLRGLPISFPSTTGVPAPMPGGRIARRP